MQNLIFTAKLRSPLIKQGFLTFDGLLAAVLFDRCGDFEEAHSTIPILCTDGLFHASAAMISKPMVQSSRTIIASMRADHDLDDDLFPKNKSGRIYRKMNRKRRRDLGNVLSSYQTISTPDVSWICTGDKDQITELLGDLPFIGKKRAQGFGEIIKWSVEKTDLDPLLDENGAPRRPIPEHLYQGDRGLPQQDLTWRPAYWNFENRAVCYAPNLNKDQINEYI
jgi:hypothetical protein